MAELTPAALDQVKQHFDHTFATLMAELKEMKTSLDHSRRISAAPANSFLAVSPSSSQAANARQALPPIITTPKVEPRSPSPLPRGMTLAPLDASREAELRTQADELQNLRRDLAVLRQTHVDFLQETKESFGKLRVQNNSMREVVKTKMGGSRAILDNSKAKLEQQCQDTIQAVEDINDVIDAARLDAYKRFVTPSKAQMSQIQEDLKRATEMVESFARDVTSVDPTWRATWQLELSRVMEEQKLLSHQTKLAQDLKNDIKDATEMLANVSVLSSSERRLGVVLGVLPRGGSDRLRPTSLAGSRTCSWRYVPRSRIRNRVSRLLRPSKKPERGNAPTRPTSFPRNSAISSKAGGSRRREAQKKQRG
jgi:DNA-binding protein YbaB